MKKILVLFMSCLTLIAMAAPVSAEVQGGAFTFSPFFGGYVFDGTQHLNAAIAPGFRAGYNFTKNWSLEGGFTYVPLSSTNALVTTKGDQYNLRGELLYHLMPENRLVPFLALGGGWSKTVNFFGDNADATLNYGGGVKYFINDWMALRGDVRHILSFHGSELGAGGNWSNIEYNFGLSFQIPLPKAAPPVAKVEEAAPPAPEPPPAPAPAPPPPPAPAPAPGAATGPSELVLPGRLATPAPPPSAAVPEPVAPPAPPAWEGPTSWVAEKTEPPPGKVMVTGFKVVQNSLEIKATGRCIYQAYTLAQPSRLVIDIANGLNGFRDTRIQISRIGIEAVRMEDNSDFLRIILDSAQENLLPYRIEEMENGLKVIVTKP